MRTFAARPKATASKPARAQTRQSREANAALPRYLRQGNEASQGPNRNSNGVRGDKGETAPVHAARSQQGAPLDPASRAYFEPRFGQDFRDVRVHTGAIATDSARALHARAYTVGRDIVLASPSHAPDSAQGRELLGHELTHVVQQAGARGSASASPADSGAPQEQQASMTGERVAAGAPAGALNRLASPAIQRAPDPAAPSQEADNADVMTASFAAWL